MSTSVCGDGTDYATNYVRLHGELPIRWSAIEVLKEGKYSRASDVWAFGILVYEIMSRGKVPYNEFASLPETGERIKEGYTMSCPPGCPVAVYNKVMVPCWNENPSRRLGFSVLCQRLVALGVVREDRARNTSQADTFAPSQQAEVQQLARQPSDDHEEWEDSVAVKSMLGLSVHHIDHVLVPEVLARVSPPWTDYRGMGVSPVESATVQDAVAAVVIPNTRMVQCPRDGGRGCAYIDLLSGRDTVGRSDALLSYTWAYKMTSVADALKRWAIEKGKQLQRTYVWICAFCLNQHRMPNYMSAHELADEFRPRVLAIGCLLPMLEPWDAALYHSRAWCLFELYTAIVEQESVNVEIILSTEQQQAFHEALALEGQNCIDRALEYIRSENATSTQRADLDMIRLLIESTTGGYAQLNATVQLHLALWFEKQGALRTPIRMIGRNSQGMVTAPSLNSVTNAAHRNDVFGAAHADDSDLGDTVDLAMSPREYESLHHFELTTAVRSVEEEDEVDDATPSTSLVDTYTHASV